MLFISYSTIDREIANEVYAYLKSQGYYLPFLDYHPDSGIHGGAKWEEELRWQVKVAKGIIVLCSENWDESQWCFSELQLAKEFKSEIIPLNLTQMELPAKIAEYQAIAFHNRDKEAYARLSRALEEADLKPGDDFSWPKDECPYPGLKPFTEEHAAVYFGRGAELDDFLVNQLTPMREKGEKRLIYVIGPSGSGKSSFVRAGVLPRLRFKTEGNWLILSVCRWAELKGDGQSWGERLTGDIRRLYADCPLPDDWDENAVDRYAIDQDQTIDDAANKFILDVKKLRKAVSNDRATILIVLDQFEEILMSADEGEGRRFLNFIHHILKPDASPCRVIATVRSDFLSSIQTEPELFSWKDRTDMFRLDLLREENLFDVILRPAEKVGVEIETALANRIVKEANSSDALPLLAFTLRKFYEQCAGDRALTVEEYDDKLGDDKLSGLEKCLQDVADKVIDDETPQEDANALRLSFVKHLARYRDSKSSKDSFVRQTANWDDLPEAAQPLLTKMSSENFRLASIDERESGKKTVEVTHESLFRNWSLLTDWLEAGRDLLQWRTDVERDLQRAVESGSTWRGLTRAQLEKARHWPLTRKEELEENEVTWINVAARKVRRVIQAVIAGFVIIASSAVAASYFGYVAEIAKDVAVIAKDEAKIAKDEAVIAKEEALTRFGNAKNALKIASEISDSTEKYRSNKEAMVDYLALREILADLEKAQPEDVAVLAAMGNVHNAIGRILFEDKKYDDAVASYKLAAEVREKIRSKRPEYERKFANALMNMAQAYVDGGRPAEARAPLDQAQRIRKGIQDRGQLDEDWEGLPLGGMIKVVRDRAKGDQVLGNLYYDQRQFPNALKSFEEAVTRVKQILEVEQSADLKDLYASVLIRLGETKKRFAKATHVQAGKPEDAKRLYDTAEAHLKAAEQIAEDLINKPPVVVDGYQRNLGLSFGALASLYFDRGDVRHEAGAFKTAAEFRTKQAKVFQELTDRRPKDEQFRDDLGLAYVGLFVATYRAARNGDEMKPSWQRAEAFTVKYIATCNADFPTAEFVKKSLLPGLTGAYTHLISLEQGDGNTDRAARLKQNAGANFAKLGVSDSRR